MTFSYDESDLATELNKIRLYVGDVEELDPLLHDEEIALVQTDFTSFFRRCAECCRLICTKLIRRVDGKLGNLTEKSSLLYDRYSERAVAFDSKSSSSYPWIGTLYVADKEAIEDGQDDGTLIPAKFKKGQMDNKV